MIPWIVADRDPVTGKPRASGDDPVRTVKYNVDQL